MREDLIDKLSTILHNTGAYKQIEKLFDKCEPGDDFWVEMEELIVDKYIEEKGEE